jgi:hypothetical protein
MSCCRQLVSHIDALGGDVLFTDRGITVMNEDAEEDGHMYEELEHGTNYH